MVKKFQDVVKSHINDNKHAYLLLLMAFILGVSAGAFTVNGLNALQKDELSNYLHGFFQLFNSQNVKSSELFTMALLENLKLVGLIWALGVTIIGLPFIFIIIIVKGFITGFSSGFIISAMGTKGLLFSFVALLPKELIIIPCLIVIGVNGINFSMRLAKSRSVENNKISLKTAFISYCLVTLSFSCILMLGIIYDAYATPILLRMVFPTVVP